MRSRTPGVVTFRRLKKTETVKSSLLPRVVGSAELLVRLLGNQRSHCQRKHEVSPWTLSVICK